MGTMSGKDFKGRREALGLTQATMADRLELHARTISKWERSVNPIPEWAALAMSGLEAERPKRRRPRSATGGTDDAT